MDENEIRKEWEAGRLEKLKVDQMKVRVVRLCLFSSWRVLMDE